MNKFKVGSKESILINLDTKVDYDFCLVACDYLLSVDSYVSDLEKRAKSPREDYQEFIKDTMAANEDYIISSGNRGEVAVKIVDLVVGAGLPRISIDYLQTRDLLSKEIRARVKDASYLVLAKTAVGLEKNGFSLEEISIALKRANPKFLMDGKPVATSDVAILLESLYSRSKEKEKKKTPSF